MTKARDGSHDLFQVRKAKTLVILVIPEMHRPRLKIIPIANVANRSFFYFEVINR